MVGVIHTPRVFAALARGFYQRRKELYQAATSEQLEAVRCHQSKASLGEANAFVSHFPRRAGLLDCDYLGHMNNAAFLSQAEYSRWELCAYNGIVQAMFRDSVNFVVAGTAVRYRREVKWGRRYHVESYMGGLSERNIWVVQNFREDLSAKTKTTGIETGLNNSVNPNMGRIQAQLLVRGVCLRGRGKAMEAIDPRVYFVERVGLDPAAVDHINCADDGAVDIAAFGSSLEEDDDEDLDFQRDIRQSYLAMEDAMKRATTADDRILGNRG